MTPRQTDLNLESLVDRFHQKQIQLEQTAFRDRLASLQICLTLFLSRLDFVINCLFSNICLFVFSLPSFKLFGKFIFFVAHYGQHTRWPKVKAVCTVVLWDKWLRHEHHAMCGIYMVTTWSSIVVEIHDCRFEIILYMAAKGLNACCSMVSLTDLRRSRDMRKCYRRSARRESVSTKILWPRDQRCLPKSSE